MKNGSQSKPTLSARPPGHVLRTPEEAARDLERVMTITEEPARVAAQSLEPAQVPEAGEGRAVPAPKGKPVKELMPWETAEDGVISFNFKLPSKLGAKLKYLGDTTYGESMTSIVIEALTHKLDKMLKEKERQSR
jgi:hypothetical protein